MGCLNSSSDKQDLDIKPEDFRLVWKRCLELDKVVLHAPKKKKHPVFDQIGKDIDRTFPGHPFFSSPKNKESFQSVLKQFALQFPKVGYTQGLNFLAGFLLLSGLSQQQALKALIALCTHPELMMIGLYEDDFPLVKLYCSMFWWLLKKTVPEVYDVLKAANLPDQLWIFQWFITFFIYSFPFSHIQKLFNFVVVKRYFALVRLAVGVIQCLQKYIISVSKTQDGFLSCFELMKQQQFCKKYMPVDEIIRKAQKLKKDIVFKSLHQSKQNNWYRRYFSLQSSVWRAKHEARMAEFKQERKEFTAQDELSLRYTRLPTSMTIIDSIQGSMAKKYENTIYRSSFERKSGIFFSKISAFQPMSMGMLQTKLGQ